MISTARVSANAPRREKICLSRLKGSKIEMKIIDAHNHPDYHGHSFERVIENMDRNGIDKAWLLSWEAPPDEFDPNTIYATAYPIDNGCPTPFRICWEYKQKAPDRFVLGYAPDPRRPDALQKLRTAINLYNVQTCGEVKLRMMYDNPDAIEMFRLCGEMGLPVTLHFDNAGAQRTGVEFPRRSWWYGGDIDTLERIDIAAVPPRTAGKFDSGALRAGVIEMQSDRQSHLAAQAEHLDSVGVIVHHTQLHLAAGLDVIQIDCGAELLQRVGAARVWRVAEDKPVGCFLLILPADAERCRAAIVNWVGSRVYRIRVEFIRRSLPRKQPSLIDSIAVHILNDPLEAMSMIIRVVMGVNNFHLDLTSFQPRQAYFLAPRRVRRDACG